MNGQPVQMPSPAVMKNNTTFVPLRFIAEALGAKLDWKTSNKLLAITRE
ncbi:copper amine oxidase N-terminal domain-containing protein [Gordoniibacillus kamchatkensis]|nr:copper amine oxidase N-terminal domain-containing protein [Paenibacillus sp. VKM B-2647]